MICSINYKTLPLSFHLKSLLVTMVSLTEGQKTTLSPEAVEFLTKIRHPPLANTIPSFITSPCRVPGLRQGFTEKTASGEAKLIEKHKIQTTEIIIAGVSVVIIERPVVKPDKQKKILFNVFGGAFIMGSPRDRAVLTMAVELGVRVYSIDYAKSPEAKYPEALDQCLAVYRELLQNGPPGGTFIDPSDICHGLLFGCANTRLHASCRETKGASDANSWDVPLHACPRLEWSW